MNTTRKHPYIAPRVETYAAEARGPLATSGPGDGDYYSRKKEPTKSSSLWDYDGGDGSSKIWH